MKLWCVSVCVVVIMYTSLCTGNKAVRTKRVVLSPHVSDNDARTITRMAEVERKSDARATVILCHGFMCSKDDIKFLRWLFPQENTMIFDFRGHGEHAEDQCCTFGYDEAHEVIAAADYVRSDPELRKLPVIVYGFSMGAAASIRAQSLRPDLFDCAIWDAPFESTSRTLERCVEKMTITVCGYTFGIPGRDILRRNVHRPWVQGFLKSLLKAVAHIDASSVNTCIVSMEPQKLVQNVTIPALFIGCWKDERAPYNAVRSVYRNAAGYKRLWMTPGRRHFDSFFYDPDQYRYGIQTFIDAYLDGSYKAYERERILSH